MTETVVHVTTLEQWKSVLDVWFKQGYLWVDGDDIYNEHYFRRYGSRQIGLKDSTKKYICCWANNDYDGYNMIEYSKFMAQQKEDKEVKTYYVTQEQLDLIKDLKEGDWPLSRLVNSQNIFRPLNEGLKMIEEKSLLRYLGGDETIEFKVKEQLYRLFRVDDEEDTVYMELNSAGTPDWGVSEISAFKAPLEEIKKWQTPAWEIEKAD